MSPHVLGNASPWMGRPRVPGPAQPTSSTTATGSWWFLLMQRGWGLGEPLAGGMGGPGAQALVSHVLSRPSEPGLPFSSEAVAVNLGGRLRAPMTVRWGRNWQG